MNRSLSQLLQTLALTASLAATTLHGAPAAQTLTQMLSGKDAATTVPWDFQCSAGAHAGEWTTIPVPSCWEMFGFGKLRYGLDVPREKDGKYAFPPAITGHYRRKFQLPADWQGRRVAIVFDGAMTDATVSVNGQPAGPTHQGAFYRFEYDITALVKVGADNLLEVTVADESSNYSVGHAERTGDFWVFGGIFRPVWLEATPLQFVDRVAIDARADGSFAVDVFVAGQGGAEAIEAEIFDAAGRSVGSAVSGSVAQKRLTTRVVQPALWTAETPRLYTAAVRLRQGPRVVHEIRQRFGFRTVEVRPGDGVYVNGKRMLLRGVNRHSSWPTTGRTLDEGVQRLDLALLKDLNMNAVRMSHYPPDERFLELCDEEGLYVIDELTGWQANYDDETGAKLVPELIARDVNHPSIVFWANGNEGGFNKSLDPLFPALDPQGRQVLHPWAKFGPMNTRHYPTYEDLKKLLAGRDIMMPTEILHGLFDGGHGSGLADYWDLFRASKVGAGMFLWVFADEGVRAPGNRNGEMDLSGNRAPDGIVGPFREKEGSYYTIKDVWSPVQWAKSRPAGFRGIVDVENRYDFTNLSQVHFRWQLRRYRDAAGFATVAAGTAPGPRVEPGKTGALTLPLPADFGAADALAITALDAREREIVSTVWPLHSAAETAQARAPLGRPAPPPTADGEAREYRAAGTTLRVSATDGRLLALTFNGQPFPLTSGALPGARWSMNEAGWIRLDYSVTPPPPAPVLGEVGISFNYPEASLIKKTWLGNGPYRAWKNRTAGPLYGMWETAFNTTATGYKDWVYPEFAGYFAEMRWAALETKEGTLTMVTPDEHTFLRVGTPPQAPPNLRSGTAIDFPPGNLAFLRDIPAIGTKFSPAPNYGPQSTTPLVNAPYEGTVYFRVAPPR